MFKYDYTLRTSLKHLFMQRYERYLPTAFDESMSILEKMNKLIEAQNGLIDVVNSHTEYTSRQLERAFDIIGENLDKELEQFRKELEEQKTLYEEIRDKFHDDLPVTVRQELERWLNNGTMENIINDEIFDEIQHKLKTLQNRVESLEVSVKDFGAMGNDTGSSAQIQNAVDYVFERGGGLVKIPRGRYIIDATINMPSNVTISGEGRGTVLRRSPNIVTMFRSQGSYEYDVALTQNATRHDREITVQNTSSLKPGDFIKLISQRSATGEDAGNNWKLGNQTSESHRCYFGETLKIHRINNQTISLMGGLIFPDYRTTDDLENDPNARENSIIRKINFNENVHVKNFHVQGLIGTIVRFDQCAYSSVENVSWTGGTYGSVATFVECYMTEGRKLFCQYNPNTEPAEYYQRNCFKSVSSTLTGFVDCRAEYGGQNFDFTYSTWSDTATPDMFGYVINSETYFSNNNALTTHGMTFGTQIIGNRFLYCNRSGIGLRSRRTIVANNVVMGAYTDGTWQYGLRQAQETPNPQNEVTGNIFYGFDETE